MITQAQAYVAGWKACMNGVDGRYVSSVGYDAPYEITDEIRCAWMHGWLDAMEAEDNDVPDPEFAGYGEEGHNAM